MRIGLIEGRHEMPVERYLLPANVADLVGFHGGLYEAAYNAGLETNPGPVTLYITGLTVAAIGAVDGLRDAGCEITLANFDRESGDYIEIPT